MKGSIGPGEVGIIAVPLVGCLFIFPHSLADGDAGSAFNLGDGINRGATSRNPSRAYLSLVLLRRLITSR
jgi:hypothetical protein